MKNQYFLILCIFYSLSGYAQITSIPGGVKSPIIWYKTDSTRTPAFDGLDSIIALPNFTKNTNLNFHPSLVFNGTNGIAIKLPDSSLTNATFFAAYQTAAPNNEGVVWHLTKQAKTTTVFTTKRLADLESYQYMNYRDFHLSNPKIGTYTQQKLKDTIYPIKQYWTIGLKPSSPSLPVVSFSGLIPEVIAYDRILSTQERIKVGTYLAIKYGITLSDPAGIYINSRDDIIWDGLTYPDYHHNIAGIARDDTSQLYQVKAGSSNHPGLLTIASAKPFINYTSMIWGDNDKTLTKADKIPGIPTLLKRQWLIATHSNNQPFETEITLNTKEFDVPLPAQPVYWLAIDRSGKGDFPFASTEFIKMNSLDKDGKAHFTNVRWGAHKDSIEVMGIAVAEDLLAAVNITTPKCADPDGGSIEVKINGGKPPYQVQLTTSAGAIIFNKEINTKQTFAIPNLSTAKYKLTISDAAKNTYAEAFYINSSDGPKPLAVAENYTLPQGGGITIQADSGMVAGLTYEWTGPNGFHTMNPAPTFTTPGLYTLTCSNGSCTYLQDVSINRYPMAYLSENNVTVFPNPTSGKYNADVSMDQAAPVKLEIYSVEGKSLGKAQSATGMANYRFSGVIPYPGIFVLKFSSGNHIVAKKLIVIN